MKKIIFYMACVIMIGMFSAAAWSQGKEDYSIYSQEGREFEVKEIYAPRYPDRLCPPEYPGTRERIESYLSNSSVRFQQRHGAAAPRSSASVEVLDDVTDAEACQRFNEQLDEKINTQAKLSEDGQAQYWYDVTYYKGGDFYFVVSDGGILEEEDPENPGWIRSVMKHSTIDNSLLIFQRDNYEPVPLYSIEPLESDSAKDR